MAGNERSGRGGKAAERNDKRPPKSNFTKKKPRWLTGRAAEYWKDTLPRLIEAGAIQNKDVPAFCRLCDLYSKWRECQEVTSKQGVTYETTTDRGSKRVIKRPEAELEIQYHKEMSNMERKFGLTPAEGKGIKFSDEEKPKTVRDKYR